MRAKYFWYEEIEISEMESTGDNEKTYSFLVGKPEQKKYTWNVYA
jgi:hypothetical protein